MFTPPSRHERLTWALFYCVIAAGGVLVLIMPPTTIETPLGRLITPFWGFLLLTAVIPALAALKGRFKWEYTTLPLIISGILIYAATLWSLTVQTPTRATQATLTTALALGLTRRWLDRRALIRQVESQQRQTGPDNHRR